jgi:hypothetical protein
VDWRLDTEYISPERSNTVIARAPASTAHPENAFTTEQRRSLATLRDRYLENRGIFGHRELAHLRFLRWLTLTGRLTP